MFFNIYTQASCRISAIALMGELKIKSGQERKIQLLTYINVPAD